MSVILETTLGDITIDLYTSERPRTCLNFLKLCKIKYYNLCLVHSIQRNFTIQTGDPLGTGRGGESVFCKLYGDQAKFFDSENVPKLKHTKVGTVSMVNNGQNMHGSQFFITTGEDLDYLDGVHTVFGEVSEGFEVLTKINAAICDEDNRPYKDIRITHTVVLDDPYNDPAGLEIPCASPEPTEEQLRTDRIGVDEDVDDLQGADMEEVEEQIKDKEAKARAKILEMVGDLPDADVRPPENVLFVCKLNPVTTDDDLEVIFSRFGPIVSCEVIRDQKSKESLQYAFIEFEKEEDCENAYFKMDNVLIDDRRIHVDFSQSVSRLNYYQRKAGKKLSDEPSKSGNKFVLKDKSRPKRDYEMIFDDDSNRSLRQKVQVSSEQMREGSGLKSSDRRSRRSRSRSLERQKQGKMLSSKDDDERRRRRERRSRSYDADRRRDGDRYAARKGGGDDRERRRYHAHQKR